MMEMVFICDMCGKKASSGFYHLHQAKDRDMGVFDVQVVIPGSWSIVFENSELLGQTTVQGWCGDCTEKTKNWRAP